MKYPINTIGERMREYPNLLNPHYYSLQDFIIKWTCVNEQQTKGRFNRQPYDKTLAAKMVGF
jgi:hypothetical protein